MPVNSSFETVLKVDGKQVRDILKAIIPTDLQLDSFTTANQKDVGSSVLDFLSDLLRTYRSHKLSPDAFREKCSFLMQYTWEKLHTGRWVAVAPGWRVIYAVTRLLCVLYLINDNEIKITLEILEIMISDLDYSLLMGLPILDSVASKMATILHRLLTELELPNPSYNQPLTIASDPHKPLDRFPRLCNTLTPLERITRPSLEYFQILMKKGEPFIITDAISYWPACKNGGSRAWTLDYWRRIVGHRLIPVEIGSRYTDEAWGQELMTINKFIDRFIVNRTEHEPVGYLAQHQLFLQCPELGDDVITPDYCFINGKEVCPESTVDSNIWFGPVNTISPLHHDSDRANLLTQVVGEKYVVLFPASQTQSLYPHEEPMLCNTSMVDLDKVDAERYPEFVNNACGFHGIIRAGEMLFIPPRCWHYVRSLSLSFSVNFWWDVAETLIPEWPVM